jgi:hypothetical protein
LSGIEPAAAVLRWPQSPEDRGDALSLSWRAKVVLSLSALGLLGGCTEPNPIVPPITAPTGVTASELATGNIEVSWQDNSDNETGFELARSSAGPNGPYVALASVGADVMAYEDGQVDGVSLYCYRVRAVGAGGTTPSSYSAAACHQSAPPDAPSLPMATAGFAQVDVAWTDNSDDEAGFEVWASTSGPAGTFTLVATVAANVTAYNATGLQDGAEYCYRVRAVGPKGQASAFTSTVCATTPVPSSPPPAAPTDLTAAVSGSTAISLDWTDHASDEQGFEIWRSASGAAGVYAPIDTVGANATSANDAGLTSGAEYCYQVRALGNGTAPPSAFSNSSCATIPAPPAAPTGLTASPTSSTAIALAWSDNATDEAGYEVWRSTTGQTGTYSLFASVGANVTTRNNTGLTPDHEYCYQVRAVGAGFAPPSDFSSSACATPSTIPPSAVQAAAATPSRINVTWQDNSPDESGFEVWRSTTGIGGTYTLRSTRPAGAEVYSDNGLNSATEYCYEVRATGSGSASDSPFAEPVCATTPLLVRVVLFGDSNTDRCEEYQSTSNPLRLGSYVSIKPALSSTATPTTCSVAGKVVASWSGIRSESLLVVNHGIASTTTGGNTGLAGDPGRTSQGAPNARLAVNGITRFEAEVLGQGAPTWNGGEPVNASFPNGPVSRVNAYAPKPDDFAYVSMGTNDNAGATRMLTAQATVDNLRWMIEGWTATGRRADHFILTTLAPRTDGSLNSPTAITDRNVLIRALALELGVHLIDLAGHVSDDDGLTWKDPALHIGDGVHYTEAVRGWLGDQVAGWMDGEVPPLP